MTDSRASAEPATVSPYSDNAVHRCADLVAHGGEEGRLCSRGRLRFEPSFFETLDEFVRLFATYTGEDRADQRCQHVGATRLERRALELNIRHL